MKSLIMLHLRALPHYQENLVEIYSTQFQKKISLQSKFSLNPLILIKHTHTLIHTYTPLKLVNKKAVS